MYKKFMLKGVTELLLDAGVCCGRFVNGEQLARRVCEGVLYVGRLVEVMAEVPAQAGAQSARASVRRAGAHHNRRAQFSKPLALLLVDLVHALGARLYALSPAASRPPHSPPAASSSSSASGGKGEVCTCSENRTQKNKENTEANEREESERVHVEVEVQVEVDVKQRLDPGPFAAVREAVEEQVLMRVLDAAEPNVSASAALALSPALRPLLDRLASRYHSEFQFSGRV